MKELTRIPNIRQAILYKETLLGALAKSEIKCEGTVEEHYAAQESEIIVYVDDKDFEKASVVMKEIIRKGPPKT